MANLRDLATRMTKLANGLDERANNVKKAAATAIITDLILHTPVDTSRALSNWQASLGDKNGNKLEPFVPGSKGSSASASQAEAIAAAMRIIATAAPGQTIWISNNLPYIRRLNDGYSSQQPAGFVERAALVGRKTLERVKF